jgi:hypothetical protein
LVSLGSLTLAGATATLPLALLHAVGRDEVAVDGLVHLLGVGVSAAVASAAALALTIVGARRGDGRTVLLGTAFSVMAGLLAVHGATTPGFFVGMNGVVAFSGAATLPVGGALLALSALPSLRRPRDVRALVVLEATLLVGVLALGAVGIAFPGVVPPVPEPGGAVALTALGAGVVFYTVLIVRTLRAYRLTRRPADLVVVAGVVWLGAALAPALVLDYTQLGWWLGHGIELVGIVLVGGPIAFDLLRAAPTRALAGGLPAAQLVTAEEEFLGSHVRALTRLLAERDAYTEGHTRRVALRAVQVGEELGLSPERLRTLAAGGLLHDVGKLSVPDKILRKPGGLCPDEYEAIKEHPVSGERLLVELGGFAPAVRRLVRAHHERLDGSGYPDGCREAELDFETRILAVCDVYDALISTRVYREAWREADALALLHEAAGREFDGRCVGALERVLERERDATGLPLAV